MPQKKEKIDKRKIGSFSFLLAIPTMYVIAFLSLLSLFVIFKSIGFQTEVWGSFLIGAIGTSSLIAGASMQTFRTLIHELKHAILVLLSGNKLTGMDVQEGTGSVDFSLYEDLDQFHPFIALAPYFLPLFSFPVLIVAMFLETNYRIPLSLVLGCALSADVMLGYQEWHPHQTDLKRMFGGFFSSGLFINGFLLMWISLCALWLACGINGFGYLFYTTLNLVNFFLDNIF